MRRIKCLFSTSVYKPTVVFILGGPCSGKGTQSTLINDRLHYKHLSAGELLREQRKNPSSKHGELIEKTILQGKIVPSFITVSLLQQAMIINQQKYNKFLIDGFPRNMENLEKWNEAMGQKVETPFVIFLTCSQETMMKRLGVRSATSTRSDDNIEVIKKRFQTFEQQTIPVINWYRKTDRVIEVSSEKSVEQIFGELGQKIMKRSQN